jgi:glycosyltransferase involved in cell wall biosynthesis
MKILFLIPYPVGESPSQRFRFEQYFKILTLKGHDFRVQGFLNSLNWKLFFKSGKWSGKIASLLNGLLKRVAILFRALNYDFVFIHREAAPIGPPVFEWIIAKILTKKIIYDFDDAIWMTDRINESFILQAIKWRSKVSSICRWSYKVSCGNDYLGAYARQFNKKVVYNPTTIDTDQRHNRAFYPSRNENRVVIGWTGSHSTLKYLSYLEPVLYHLENKYSIVDFWVIADEPPVLKRLSRLKFKGWSRQSEIADLSQFDIGIMPLPDDEWAMGKCGFKALQYMALEIPTIASTVGVNKEIIQHGENGFLCSTLEEWEGRLTELIENEGLRNSIGIAARKTVEQRFSVSSNVNNFLTLFE